MHRKVGKWTLWFFMATTRLDINAAVQSHSNTNGDDSEAEFVKLLQKGDIIRATNNVREMVSHNLQGAENE